MIDINELRRLAQAATHPTTKGRWMRLFGERTVYDRLEDGCRGVPIVATDYHPPGPQEAAYLDFIAAANPNTISEFLDRFEAAEKERDNANAAAAGIALRAGAMQARLEIVEKERDALLAKVAEMEKQEPIGVLHVGSYYGEELQDWEFEANQCACDKLNEAYVSNPTSLPLYALPGAQAQPAPKAVAYLDLGVGGYMDVGTDLTDEELATLPKGRHMLGIIGTYGVDGYVPAQPAPISDIIDRLEAAEKERDAAELMSLALRAKIAEMEKQEPVAWMLNCPTLGGDTGWILSWTQSGAGLCNRLQGEENEKRLYALPGAGCAPSVPEGWQLVPTAESRHPGIYKMLGALHAADNTPGMSEWESYRAMLSEAPEVKP